MADNSDTFNRRQYDQFASAYHAKRQDKQRSFYNDHLEQPMMAKLLRDRVRSKKVLDLGCGSGLFTSKLKKWGADVAGVDFSQGMLEIARTQQPDIKFFKANLTRLPFPSGSFDIVASSLVLHYLKNPKTVCKEVWRVLKPCGYFVFSMHHPFSSFSLLGQTLTEGKADQLAGANYFQHEPYRWRMLPGMELVSYHQTFETIASAVTKSGFLIESLLEAKPAKRTRPIDPKSYDESSRYPTFVAIRALKMPCRPR